MLHTGILAIKQDMEQYNSHKTGHVCFMYAPHSNTIAILLCDMYAPHRNTIAIKQDYVLWLHTAIQ